MLTTRQAAEFLRISVYYLRNMRQGQHNHDGPTYLMLPGRRNSLTAFYNKELLLEWAKLHKWKKVKA